MKSPPGLRVALVDDHAVVREGYRRLHSGFGHLSNLTVAYKQPGSAEEGLWLAGRTAQGVNEYTGSPFGVNPTRDPGYKPNRSP